MAIKNALGKLPLGRTPSQLVDVSVREPLHHKDPFDRILVAQAQVNDLTLVTADHAIQQYGGSLMAAT